MLLQDSLVMTTLTDLHCDCRSCQDATADLDQTHSADAQALGMKRARPLTATTGTLAHPVLTYSLWRAMAAQAYTLYPVYGRRIPWDCLSCGRARQLAGPSGLEMTSLQRSPGLCACRNAIKRPLVEWQAGQFFFRPMQQPQTSYADDDPDYCVSCWHRFSQSHHMTHAPSSWSEKNESQEPRALAMRKGNQQHQNTRIWFAQPEK